ncbi:hypothetical protein NQ317_006428 [Molorchus minor]|uniref:Uncharacterized protein n=1 Tax=Molorchus minor TaxID=1323400 RepID=A0ABQ9IVG3_9CUCU|nr:hypothetical protein NQ317_006428 [Molorchus minor]
MRATLSLPAARDPEVLERLDPTPFSQSMSTLSAPLNYRCQFSSNRAEPFNTKNKRGVILVDKEIKFVHLAEI